MAKYYFLCFLHLNRVTPTADDDDYADNYASLMSGLPPGSMLQNFRPIPAVPREVTMKMPPLDPNAMSFLPKSGRATTQGGHPGQSSAVVQQTNPASRARIGINVRQDIHPTPTIIPSDANKKR